jgi:hypothetical protein
MIGRSVLGMFTVRLPGCSSPGDRRIGELVVLVKTRVLLQRVAG